MGCTPSRGPPPYRTTTIRYHNPAVLRWSLRVLARPPRNLSEWRMAYDVAAVSIAAAHRVRARTVHFAVLNPGVVTLAATAARRELQYGGIILTTTPFVITDPPPPA